MNLRELIGRILDELRGAWRFRWWTIAVAWAICVVGWIVILAIPDTYEAKARVYVDTRSVLRPLLQGLAIDPQVTSGLDLVRQALLSKPQIDRVARETGLDERAKTPAAREALMQGIQERISIDAADMRARTAEGDGTYLISFRDHDRGKSVQVVQKLLSSFMESAAGDKRTGNKSAQRFIEEQIADYEQRLASAEQRLATFKQQNVGLMPDSRGDYFGRMQQENTELDRVRTALSIAETRRGEIQRQLSGEEPFLFGFDSGEPAQMAAGKGAGGDLTFRIQDLQRQLDDLLLRYTDKHPEVMAMRNTIEELKQRQQEELARIKSGKQATGSLGQSLKTNPVYQNLTMEMKRTEVQVAELRQELSARTERGVELQRQVNQVPEVEAELARLNRDYEVTHQKYLELVQRRETASLSESADRSSTTKFEIIEPPSAPLSPVSPDRPRLLLLVLMAGLGVGLGLAWVMNQLKPVFHGVRTLADVTGLPVLGAISRTWMDRHRQERRQQVLAFSAATVLLFVSFALLLVVQSFASQHVMHLMG
jgi:polysaccharide chain length determinant protein (PEP-CTERM system associated)